MGIRNSLSRKTKGHVVACVGEFVGTFLFLFLAEGGANAVNTAPQVGDNATSNLAADPAKLLYICLCFGFSLAVNAWVFYRISGGLFNPAVTFGMVLIGKLTYVRGVCLFIVQLAAGVAASALVSGLLPGPLNVSTKLQGGTSVVQGLFIEMFLTAELVFTIFLLAAEKHEGQFIAPVGIGLALFIAQLFGVYYTGASLNPARTLGPASVSRHFFDYHWIYWVGPLLGAALAAALFKLVKFLDYETVNLEKEPQKEPCVPVETDLEAQNQPSSGDEITIVASGEAISKGGLGVRKED